MVAVTAAHAGRANGLISSTAVSAGIIPESRRLSIALAKASLTHDLVLASGAFAVHLLPDDERGLELFHVLGMRSGHDEDKLRGISTRTETTASPILDDAVAYVEARVVRTLDGDDLTIVLADVVAGARAQETPVLTIDSALARMSARWLEEWERRREAEIREARRRR